MGSRMPPQDPPAGDPTPRKVRGSLSLRPPSRVDQTIAVVFPARTLLMVIVVTLLTAIAVINAGRLLAIFAGVVPALGLAPPVSWMVRRGWKRGAASLAAF